MSDPQASNSVNAADACHVRRDNPDRNRPPIIQRTTRDTAEPPRPRARATTVVGSDPRYCRRSGQLKRDSRGGHVANSHVGPVGHRGWHRKGNTFGPQHVGGPRPDIGHRRRRRLNLDQDDRGPFAHPVNFLLQPVVRGGRQLSDQHHALVGGLPAEVLRRARDDERHLLCAPGLPR